MGEIMILIILILVNAFFAASEIAFISLNEIKIDSQIKEGNKKAKKIKNMLENPSKFLATIQIGITLAGFLSSAFASESFASVISPILFEKFPAISLSIWNGISIVIITVILSYFTLVFGELVPKRLGMKNSEKIAFASIGIISLISKITAPFVSFLTFSTNIISKIFGVTANDEETVSEEEIKMMLDLGHEKGMIREDERKMINNVFAFNDKIASEIMIPRTDMLALDMDLSISQVIDELKDNWRYSRIPVYDKTIDNIKGVIYLKDILLESKNKDKKIKNMFKEVYFASETKPINELFDELRRKRRQIAIVIDEYGGTAGMVTMEDILEEIVGEIFDEYDDVRNNYEQIDEKTFICSGDMGIGECRELLGINIDDGYYDTLSGFLTEKLGHIPTNEEKPTLEINEVKYVIEKVKNKRIIKVKIIKL